MSTRELERELAAVLHRRAEHAMNETDTQSERERLREVLEVEPRTGRRRWVVGIAVAAAAVATVALWAANLGDDRADPAPAQPPDTGQLEREAELVAEQVVAAYAGHDADAVASYLSPSEKAWPDLRLEVPRNRAWNVEYLLKGCTARTTTPTGILVGCPTDLHVLYSEEVGEEPFHDSTFWIFVEDGVVTSGEVYHPFETNGMNEYIDSVWAWIEEHHPEDAAFLDRDEPDVPRAQWESWLRLWEKRAAEYADAMTRRNGGES